MIIESEENIIDSKSSTIVNTVNCVGVMGGGVALAIKEAFPWCLAPYKDACEKEILRPGGIFVITIHVEPVMKYPTIINLATKDHWRGKSKIEWVDKGLEKLSEYITKNKITSLSIPRPGCGHGGLKWDDVELLVKKHLGNLECDITIHHRTNLVETKTNPKLIQTTLTFEEE